MKRALALFAAIAGFFGVMGSVQAQCNMQSYASSEKVKTEQQLQISQEIRAELVASGVIDKDVA